MSSGSIYPFPCVKEKEHGTKAYRHGTIETKQLLQLKRDGTGIREMARRLGISRNSVRKYLSLTATLVEDYEMSLFRDGGPK